MVAGMKKRNLDFSFWKDRRVLLTGHTGFKGTWAALLLEKLQAKTLGVSLAPTEEPNLYKILSPWSNLNSIYCDIRDRKALAEVVHNFKPEIVIHMAAQALVRESYHNPIDTFETNIMGTAYLLNALRDVSNLKAVLVITSDKVYENLNSQVALVETSPLGGYDPYSASKASTEFVAASFAKSFFSHRDIPVCTARAGNVIGGGDWAKDRLIPDLWRAYTNKQPVEIRYPKAIRPWQHVLDPIYGYLLYIEQMVAEPNNTPKALNFGPSPTPLRTVLELAERFSFELEAKNLWTLGEPPAHFKESQFLSIDIKLAEKTLDCKAELDVDNAIVWTAHWYKAFDKRKDMRQFSMTQMESYLN